MCRSMVNSFTIIAFEQLIFSDVICAGFLTNRKRGGYEEEKREHMEWTAAQQQKITDSVRGWFSLTLK